MSTDYDISKIEIEICPPKSKKDVVIKKAVFNLPASPQGCKYHNPKYKSKRVNHGRKKEE